jgi:opacity protein-like surface antigen
LTWAIKHFTPYVDIGLGSAWTQTNGYTETVATTDGYVSLSAFQNHTNRHFAYQAGLGVGYAFNISGIKTDFQHERISVGYRYVNLGNASFGTRGSTYPYKLNLGRLSSNDLYLSYTHLF